MKQIIAIAALALVSVGVAQAQTINNFYKAQDGVPFNTATVKSFTGLSGSVKLEYAGAVTSSAVDGTGAIYQALITDTNILAKYVQVGATTRWLNTDKIILAACNGNRTQIYWDQVAYATEIIADNCATYHQIQTRSK